MNDIPLGVLFGILFVLIILSGFFSGSETALMTLNRYRLKHLKDKGHKGAILASALLKRPDRLLGLILLGNNFVNILASAIATVIAMRLYGEAGIAIATGLLTMVILVFAEVTPKTMAAIKPERFAFPAAFVYTPLLKISYPLVWLVNLFANGILGLFGMHPAQHDSDALDADELRSVVSEAGKFIPSKHADMLISILDLENVHVEDIMIPRNEITGIDLNDDWKDIEKQIAGIQRTRVPVYYDSIDDILGFLHMRKVLSLMARDELTLDNLKAQIREAYFVPEGTALTRQLLNFQANRRRAALVVDEYGSIQGLITLEDILEEIVGQFTTDSPTRSAGIQATDEGDYLIDGATHIRDINRTLGWKLPADGPKTLNGLILEHLEMIPEPGVSLKIGDYAIEITRVSKNAVQTARVTAIVSPGASPDENTSDG